MANINNVTQLLPTAHEGYVDNLSASISSEAATVPVNSASAYQDGDVVVLVVDPGTPEEATFTGTKASSPDRFVNCEWTEGNIGAGHASGAAVVDYISATHYNLLAKALKGILNQDGSYKSSVLESILNVNKRTEDLFGDFLVQAPITDTTGLAQTYGEVIGYIGGARIKADSGAVKVLTATSDNYVSFDNTGAINVTALAVGSAQPALPANSLWLGKYTTNASSITATDETLRVTSPVDTHSIRDKAVTQEKLETPHYATVAFSSNGTGGGQIIAPSVRFLTFDKVVNSNGITVTTGSPATSFTVTRTGRYVVVGSLWHYDGSTTNISVRINKNTTNPAANQIAHSRTVSSTITNSQQVFYTGTLQAGDVLKLSVGTTSNARFSAPDNNREEMCSFSITEIR